MRNLLLLLLLFGSLPRVSGQSWLQRADFGGTGRHRASGFAIGNKGYIGIGHVNGTGVNISYNDWWQYDPASNSWTQKADYVAPSYGAIAFATSTKGYIGGGTAHSTQYFEYDPALNTWSPIALCPLDIDNQTAFSVNDKGYVIGGSQVAEYDPSIDSWSMKASVPITVGVWSCSFVVESSAFVKSGTALYEFKPDQNTWLPRASCPGVATGGSAAFASHNKGYIVTGYSGGLSNVTKEVWEFNPATNTWLQRGDFEGAARRFSVGFNIGNRGYLGTGTNGINFNDFWAYDQFVGLEKLQHIDCTIYPNPSVEYVKIRLNEIGNNYRLDLRDANGKVVFESDVESLESTIDVRPFAAGNYVVSISQQGQSILSSTLQIQHP